MTSTFPQLVPSQVCLSCDGCCRFPEPESFWRPRIVPEERLDLTTVMPAAQVQRCVTHDGCLGTTAGGSGHQCQFFRPGDHTCAIYNHRPFECRVYPLLVGWFGGVLKVAFHMSCPFVQDHWGEAALGDYANEVRRFFQSADGKNFLQRNAALLPDYSTKQDEVEVLFTVPDLDSRGELEADWPRLEQALDAALQGAERPLSEFALAPVAGWQAHFRFVLRNIQGVPCLFASNALGTFLYLPPLGPASASMLEECFALMAATNPAPPGVARMDNVPASWLAHLPSPAFTARQRGCEYIYRREDIVRLAGNAYKSKRSDWNQAQRRWQPRVRPFAAGDADVCEDLFRQWSQERQDRVTDETYRQLLDDSRAVHLTVLRNAGRWKLTGRVVEVDGAIKGYTFGYALNDQTFCVMLEVTDLGLKGLAAYLFRQLCADPGIRAYCFINVMDDSGLPSLARVKRSFRPLEERPVYTVTRTEREAS